MSARKDDELFFIDTIGKDHTVNKRAIKKLKIDEIIEPQSSFTIGRTNTPKTGGEEALIARRAKTVNRSSAPVKKTTKATSAYDLWADDESSSSAVRPSELRRPVLAEAPAVPVPNGAVSYNPLPEEHISLLTQLEEEELARLAAIQATLDRTAVPEATGKDMMIEANRKLLLGQAYDESGSEAETEQVDDEETTKSTPTPRLTRAERRKKSRRIANENMVAAHRARKLFNASIEKAPQILKELKAAEEAEKALETVLPELEAEARRTKFQERIKKRLVVEPLAVKLPEELPSCLRRLAVEGNLVSERFRSFIERGVVEVDRKMAAPSTKKVTKRFLPLFKKVERHSYKGFK